MRSVHDPERTFSSATLLNDLKSISDQLGLSNVLEGDGETVEPGNLANDGGVIKDLRFPAYAVQRKLGRRPSQPLGPTTNEISLVSWEALIWTSWRGFTSLGTGKLRCT